VCPLNSSMYLFYKRTFNTGASCPGPRPCSADRRRQALGHARGDVDFDRLYLTCARSMVAGPGSTQAARTLRPWPAGLPPPPAPLRPKARWRERGADPPWERKERAASWVCPRGEPPSDSPPPRWCSSQEVDDAEKREAKRAVDRHGRQVTVVWGAAPDHVVPPKRNQYSRGHPSSARMAGAVTIAGLARIHPRLRGSGKHHTCGAAGARRCW
jgi:hypothetical protein